MKGDLQSKIVSIGLIATDRTVLQDKDILPITNNGRIDFETRRNNPEVLNYTSYHWIPISTNPAAPVTSTLTLERQTLLQPLSEFSRLLGLKNPEQSFYTVKDNI